MKVTKKYLTDWINERIPDINDGLSLIDIKAVNKNTNPAMGFVAKIIFMFETEGGHSLYIYSFFSMKEIADHLDSGKYELRWKFKGDSRLIMGSEIDLRKIIIK